MIEVVNWKHTVPMFGNKLNSPYGELSLKVTNEQNNTSQIVKRKYRTDKTNCFIINNKKYILNISGRLYKPEFKLEERI